MEDWVRIAEEESRALSSSNPRERLRAVARLAQIAGQLPLSERDSIVAQLERVADDSEAFVRWNLAIALGEIGHPRGLAVLERLATDEHANVRFRAALAVGLIGAAEGLPIVERLAADPYTIGEHYPVRGFVAVALGKLRHENGVRVLAGLCGDADPVVRWHAAVALGDIGHASGVPHLARLIEDPIPFVRAHTAIAMAQIGHENGVPHLERLARDSVPRVAKISQDALALLKGTLRQ